VRKNIHFTYLILMAFLFLSCSDSVLEKAKKDFLEYKPTCDIVTIKPVEGDSSAVYFEVRFKERGQEKEYTEVWQYIKSDDNWILKNRNAQP
jgi:hypothetical protein